MLQKLSVRTKILFTVILSVLLLSVVVAFVLAALSWYLVERPALSLKAMAVRSSGRAVRAS